MAETQPVWTDAYKVRAAESDSFGLLSPVALANFLQETAGNHASSLDWGVDDLLGQGLTWVLSRLHVEIQRWPAWRDDLRVTTWPAGVLRAFAVREFRVSDTAHHDLAVGTSGWLLVDVQARRPRRPAPGLLEIARHTPPRVLDDPFDRLPEVPHDAAPRQVGATLLDLDLNRHVNNVTLIRWALEATPEGVIRDHELAAIEVEFRAECLAGDTVDAYASALSEDGRTFGHRLIRRGDGRDLALARTRWRPRG